MSPRTFGSGLVPNRVAGLERDAWVHLVATADRQAVAAAGLSITELDGAIALRCRAGGPLFNRAYGAPADARAIDRLRLHYEQANVPLYFVEIDAHDPGRAAREAEAGGLVRYRRGMLELERTPSHVTSPATALEIRPASASELMRAAQLFCAAFDVQPVLAPVLASSFAQPSWQVFIAHAERAPIAVAVLHHQGDTGYLFGAATAPGFRAMGAQSALIAARLVRADELGLRVVGVRTGEPVPGDPQHSHRNLVRNGFQAVGRSDSYTPPGIAWNHGRRN